MIRMRDLLAEITMGSIAPYATQFVWRDVDAGYETKVECDGVTVLFENSRRSNSRLLRTICTNGYRCNWL